MKNMKKAKIYIPAKTAMQSGRGKIKEWVLEFETKDPSINSLMGWETSTDTLGEVTLKFQTKEKAIEYAKKNININCVSPGFIKTEMTDKINEEFKNNLINKIPSGNLGTGQDVSNCVAFLASDMANYINGETIHVNGGMYMA